MRSGRDKSDKPKGLVLPPSTQHFVSARDGRATMFSDLTRKWKPVVKQKVEEPETQAPVDDSKLPAFLRQRPTRKDTALFFRTQPSATRAKKK
jgi:hypothetical protein